MTTSSEPELQRIFAEFIEMPGLRLTRAQAQRLWGLDEVTCRRLLDQLVAARFLGCPLPGIYARLTEGAASPSLMAAALQNAESESATSRAASPRRLKRQS